MERYFILDNFNTWYDWNLILTSKSITPPEPKTNYVAIDGMNGTLDMSEALTGEITYNDRTITMKFWTDHGTRDEREQLLNDIRLALHGRKIKIIEPDDPDHYFYGRIKIKSEENIIPYAEFTIEATCEPWRYANEDSNRHVIVSPNESIDVVIINQGKKTITPTIAITGAITVAYGDTSATLSDGSYKISDLNLRRGTNVLNVSGNGAITFTYKEASL